MINNDKCAKLFVEALEKKMPLGGLEGYTEGSIPSEVHSVGPHQSLQKYTLTEADPADIFLQWSEFVGLSKDNRPV